MKKNKTCIVCSKKYAYCNNCEEHRNLEYWHAIYCSNNCKKLFETASDYWAGAITKEEAKEQFSKCDLSYKKDLHKKIAEAIDSVQDAEVKPKTEEPVKNEFKNESKNEFKRDKFVPKK